MPSLAVLPGQLNTFTMSLRKNVCVGGEKTAVETLTSPVAWLRRLVDVGMAGHHVARSVSRLAELLVAVEALPLVVLVLFLRHYKTK